MSYLTANKHRCNARITLLNLVKIHGRTYTTGRLLARVKCPVASEYVIEDKN